MTATMDNGGRFDIGEHLMTASNSEHRAWCPDGEQWAVAWRVSWLPGQLFDRNQAITAMMLTVEVSSGTTTPEQRKWPFVRSLADELGVDPVQAVAAVLAPPDATVQAARAVEQVADKWRHTKDW